MHNQIKNSLSKTVILIFICLLSFSCYATTTSKWYRIEVLVFEQGRSQSSSFEEWPVEPGFPRTQTAVSLNPAIEDDGTLVEEDDSFTLLPESELQLVSAADKLRKKEKARILVHKSWRQHLTKHKKEDPIHIFGGMQFEYSPEINNNFLDNSITGGSLSVSEAPEYNFFEVDGTIKVKLSRFLHVTTDLLFHKPMKEISGGDRYKRSFLFGCA